MDFWKKNRLYVNRARVAARKQATRRSAFEPLEERQLLAVGLNALVDRALEGILFTKRESIRQVSSSTSTQQVRQGQIRFSAYRLKTNPIRSSFITLHRREGGVSCFRGP